MNAVLGARPTLNQCTLTGRRLENRTWTNALTCVLDLNRVAPLAKKATNRALPVLISKTYVSKSRTHQGEPYNLCPFSLLWTLSGIRVQSISAREGRERKRARGHQKQADRFRLHAVCWMIVCIHPSPVTLCRGISVQYDTNTDDVGNDAARFQEDRPILLPFP